MSLISRHRSERLSSFGDLPSGLRAGWDHVRSEPAMGGVLTPSDTGMRFETDDVDARHRASPYPVVRWQDQWGTFCEHRRGEVRQIPEASIGRPDGR